MITLPRRLLEEILSHARREAPKEVCGWLAGRGERILKVLPVPNAAKDPHLRFRMDPEAQLRTMHEIDDGGMEIVGTYHSHPKTSPIPSPHDRELALYPEAAHLIVSLAVPEPQVRCYRIAPEKTVEIGLLLDP